MKTTCDTGSLKEIYGALGDASSYAALWERLGFSPRDREHLAKMEISKRHLVKALEWLEKGITLKTERDWHDEDEQEFYRLKPEILRHLARKDDALALADFQGGPERLRLGAIDALRAHKREGGLAGAGPGRG